MTAYLTGGPVTELPEKAGQFLAAKIAGNFHTASSSSFTR